MLLPAPTKVISLKKIGYDKILLIEQVIKHYLACLQDMPNHDVNRIKYGIIEELYYNKIAKKINTPHPKNHSSLKLTEPQAIVLNYAFSVYQSELFNTDQHYNSIRNLFGVIDQQLKS